MRHALRPATAADLPFAFALYRDLMHALTVEQLPWKEEGQHNVVARGIDSGAVHLVLVEQEAVGWVQINELPDAVELGQIYLRREWQGRGLGTELVRAVKRRARAAGKPAKLSVMRNNPRAQALYERLGFREVERDRYKLHLRWEPAPIEVREESLEQLPEYSRLSIAFQVDRVLQVELVEGGLGGLSLFERPVEPPYLKDHDVLPGNHPSQLPIQLDVSRWGWLAAWTGGERVGGAILAFDTEGVHLLAGRRDRVALWDLRVAPEARGQGIGRALFRAAEAWAVARGCSQLVVETQNVNVAACRLYAAAGCELGAVHRFAYPELPDEVQLLWFKSVC
jgi:ribosomal protein S18 acetylase RimI-like enzyme